ncbi:MAG: hypothetical protein OXC06_15285, partial [Acidimicrobiaceae bacterium]|nr:hypothetical protein [Acidimicrobiaceae bacterium]
MTLTATGTAGSGDYTLPSAFTIAQGQSTGTGTVQITDDDLDEDNETIILSASGTGLTVTGVTLTITDNDTAGVTLSQTARSVEVGATNTYTVVLDSQPTASVTVTPTSASTDKATVTPASVTFTTANWKTPKTFTVTGVAVGTSAITHAATSSDTDYSIGTVGTVTATVGASTKTFRIESTKTVAEGSTASLTVTLGQAAPTGGLSLSVAYSYSGSSAGSAADLGASPPSSVTVSPGSTTATLRVPTNNDSLVEGDETFTVTLSTSVSGWAGTSGETAATVTVTDDDDDNARIGFGTSGRTAAYTRNVAEDVSGGVLNVPIQVSRLPQASTTVTVEVRTGGTATEYQSAQAPGDFRIATKSVTFTATGNRTQNLAVTITDDMLVEDDQTILLRIADSGSSGMDSHYSRHASGRLATVTIADDDDDGARIAFGGSATATAPHTGSVDEDVSGGSLSVPVTINRRPETSTVFSVQVVAQGANRASEYVSAQNPGDFQIATKSVTFGPTGALSKNLTVSVTDDDWVEEDQTIVLRIVDSPASGANSLGRHYSRHNAAKTAILTITDDDADDAKIAIPNSPSFSFDTDFGMRLSNLNLVEGSNVGVPVRVSHLPETSTVFNLSVLSAGTNESSSEYSIVTMSVTFGPSTAKEQSMNVVSVNDDLVENDKTIAVRLDDSPASGANKLGRHYTRNAQSRQATLNVDDVGDQVAAKIAFHASNASSTTAYTASVDEDDGTVDVPVTVSLLPESSTTFTVEVLETATRPATEYTNAQNPGDYRVLGNKQVSFASSGAKTRNVRVQLNDNALVEHPETVQLRIVAADSPVDDLGDYYDRHASSRSATLTVADDDAAAARIAIGSSASSTAKYTVSRSEDHSQMGLVIPIRVSHAPSEATTFALEVLAASTATENTDYSMPLKTIIFTPSGLSDNVPVSFTDDDWVEHDQTIEVRIAAADATVDDLGDYYTRDSAGATGTVTIEDDEQREAKVAFGTAARTSAYTANGEEVVGTLTVPVAINHLPESNTTFTVEVLDTSTARETDDPTNATGNPKDFGIAAKTVTFGAATAKTMNITIAIANDVVEEDDEEIRLRVVAADTTVDDLGDHYDRHSSGSTARVTVKSEDQVSKVTLSTTAPPGPRNNLYAVHEGTAMTVTATADIPVGPGGWRVTPRMRPYGSLPGFASAADVRFASFVIPEGQTSATGKITFVQDNTAEPQEQLIVQGSARRRTRTLQTALSGLVAAGGLRVQISDGGAGATVSTTSLEIVEAEATTYEISLNAAPTADVVVTPSSNKAAVATVSGALTFTTSNWQTPQPVTVTGVGDGTATISHTVTSADLTYNGLTTVLDVAVKVLEPAQTFSLAVKETGARSGIGTEGTPIELEITLGDLAPTGGLEFTVTQLAAQGTTPTTVTVAEGERRVSFDAGIADDTTAQVTLRVRSVTVTTAVSGWNAKTAAAGDVSLSFEDDDGGEATVAFGASATPTGAHLVTVAENVSAGTVEVPVTISGGGSTDITFNVAVLSDSTATVRSTCDVAGADFAIADRTITFASTDGLTKNLTVTICDDDAVEPDETIRLGFAPARSPARTVADLYARRPAGNLQAVITIDSEDAPTTVSLRAGAGGVQHATGNVREGSSVTITATLDKPADVGGVAIALRVASGVGNTAGAAEYTLPASFIIPAGQTSATAQVRLLDDDEVDGLKYLRLTATTTPALTLVWAQPAAPYMDISISDTDSPGITASDTSPTVAQGQSAPYTIRLNTRPSANVTVAVAVDDTAIATVAPVTLTFTPNNFRDPQTVRIRGRQTGATTITHTATSTDTNYNTTLTAQLTVTTPTTTTTITPITGGPTTTTITGGPPGGPPVGGDPTDEDPADEDPDRRFADVDPAGVHSADIEALAAAGITAGCGTEPVRYCPDRAVTRAQMATFL